MVRRVRSPAVPVACVLQTVTTGFQSGTPRCHVRPTKTLRTTGRHGQRLTAGPGGQPKLDGGGVHPGVPEMGVGSGKRNSHPEQVRGRSVADVKAVRWARTAASLHDDAGVDGKPVDDAQDLLAGKVPLPGLTRPEEVAVVSQAGVAGEGEQCPGEVAGAVDELDVAPRPALLEVGELQCSLGAVDVAQATMAAT